MESQVLHVSDLGLLVGVMREETTALFNVSVKIFYIAYSPAKGKLLCSLNLFRYTLNEAGV